MVILPKGLVHGFGRKFDIFPSFFFSQYRPGKCVFLYSRTKIELFTVQKEKVDNVENGTFL